MRVSAKGLMALRISVAVLFVLVWNAAFILAIYFNEGLGRIENPRSLLIVSAATLGTAALAVTILLSPSARRALFSPGRAHHYQPAPYVLIAFVTLILGIAALWSAIVAK